MPLRRPPRRPPARRGRRRCYSTGRCVLARSGRSRPWTPAGCCWPPRCGLAGHHPAVWTRRNPDLDQRCGSPMVSGAGTVVGACRHGNLALGIPSVSTRSRVGRLARLRVLPRSPEVTGARMRRRCHLTAVAAVAGAGRVQLLTVLPFLTVSRGGSFDQRASSARDPSACGFHPYPLSLLRNRASTAVSPGGSGNGQHRGATDRRQAGAPVRQPLRRER